MLRAGWIIFGVGGAMDVLLHTLAHEWDALQTPFGPAGYVAHFITLAGMFLIVLGLVVEAVRHRNAHAENRN